MDRKTLIAVAMSSLLTAAAVTAIQAGAAPTKPNKITVSPGENVVCSSWIEIGKMPAFIEAQLTAGKSNIRVAESSGYLAACAW